MDFTSSEEILDILFDKEDPLLKDVDYYLGDNNNEGYNELKNSVFQNNDHDFWNSLLKDVENDYYPQCENKYSADHLDTDSTSYCNSLSPQSASSSGENNESSYLIESVNASDYSTIDVPKVTALYHSYASPAAPPETLSTNIDIGADVVVVTSDTTTSDSSFHSVDIGCSDAGSESEVIEKPKKKQSRKRTLDDSVFESVPEILKLTEDEKKLIKKEGLIIPTHLPLTKAEEKELKRIRRKIRNKQSAQESRKRKKEYVDGLETRVKICTAENIKLQKKVQTLEKEQKGLMDKIKQLQEALSNTTGKSVQTSTCFMVVFMSLALVLFPNLLPNPVGSKDLYRGQKQPVSRTSRTLFQVTENSDPNPIQGKMTDENISHSNIKHISEIKPESFDEAFHKIFQGFSNVPPIKTEPFPSSDYVDLPIDMHSNSADLSAQNKNSYTVISNETNSKKKIMLFNK